MYHTVDPKSASAKAWVGSRSFAGIAGSNPAGNMDVSLSVVCCHCVNLSLAQESRTDCGVCECGRGVSKLRRPWPIRVCFAIGVMYLKSTE
jgi:hypothetical protein